MISDININHTLLKTCRVKEKVISVCSCEWTSLPVPRVAQAEALHANHVRFSSLTQRDESVCEDCGGPNPSWFAPLELWSLVFPNATGITCAVCFMRRVAEIDDHVIFKIEVINVGETEIFKPDERTDV